MRKITEIKRPSERTFRLLIADLERLGRQRERWSFTTDAFAQDPEVSAPALYKKALAKARAALHELAPEIVSKLPGAGAGGKLTGKILKKSSTVYHQLCMKYHPDHGGPNEVMKDLNLFWEAINADVAAAKQEQ